jgi:type III secretory pathway component EscS
MQATIYLKEMLYVVLIISAVPLICSSIIGLVISFFQAATQIQEQSVSFFLKVLACSLAVYLLSDWISFTLNQFFTDMLNALPKLI